MMFFDLSLQAILVSSFIAIILDHVFSEVKNFHPLVGFGRFSNLVEKRINNIKTNIKSWGCFSWLVCMIPLFMITLLLNKFKADFLDDYLSIILDGIILYFVIGHKSLQQHALNIFNPLRQNNEQSLINARKQIAMMVSRDTTQLSQQQICRATVESVLENGHDAVIASLFWYAIGGLPFAILHRLVNTLDAMWGYRNEQFVNFGWCAAKMDDLMGWPSAKITVFLYALQGITNRRFVISLIHAKQQSQKYKSLNGGWVMAAGATVLNVKLGGLAVYEHHQTKSITLGQGEYVVSNDILRGIKLVSNSVWWWIALLGIMALLEKFF